MSKKVTLTLNGSERELLKKLLAEHYNTVFHKAKSTKLDINLTDKEFDPYGYKKYNNKLRKLHKKMDKISKLINTVKHRND